MNPTLFFYHANGFSAKTYSQFLEKMDSFSVKYIELHSSGIISLKGSMQKLVEKVIRQLCERRSLSKETSGSTGSGDSGKLEVFLDRKPRAINPNRGKWRKSPHKG